MNETGELTLMALKYQADYESGMGPHHVSEADFKTLQNT
jgi:hypothetical protein